MDPIFTVVIIFGGFAIGGITGFYAAKTSIKKTGMGSKEPPTIHGTPKPDFTREGFSSLLHLWRKKDSSGLAVEIDGVMFADRSSMSKEAIHRLQGLAREWISWLGAVEELAAKTADVPPALSQSPDQAPKKALPEKMLSTPPAYSGGLTAGSPRIETDQKIKAFRNETIAEQIDGILQEKIAEAGMDGKEIKIIEDLKHSVIFQVGQKSFHSLDEIDNPEALRLIRQAVAEWEKRTAKMHRK